MQVLMADNHRLHKPGVAGSSPAAASICRTPAEIYHGWEETSCSQLKCLRESPLAFYWRFERGEAPDRQSDALDYGTLLHTWAEVGEEDFWPRVEVCPDTLATSTGAFSAKAKDWKANLDPDKIAICPADYKKLRDQTRALLANPDVQRLLPQITDAEFNVRWKWAGHACRCRVDAATADGFIDWKTTRDANPAAEWWRSALKFGYHLQSAMYTAAGLAAGWPAHRMTFVVTSTVWPYESVVGPLPQKIVDRGHNECLRLLDELAMRREMGCWHRLTTDSKDIYFPPFALKGDES